MCGGRRKSDPLVCSGVGNCSLAGCSCPVGYSGLECEIAPFNWLYVIIPSSIGGLLIILCILAIFISGISIPIYKIRQNKLKIEKEKKDIELAAVKLINENFLIKEEDIKIGKQIGEGSQAFVYEATFNAANGNYISIFGNSIFSCCKTLS